MAVGDALRSFFNSTKKSPRLLDANTVRRTKLDDGMFDKMVETADTFRKVVQREPDIEVEGSNVPDELREKFKHFPDLMGDIFKSLFTGEDPGVLSDEEIKPSRIINRKIAQRVITSDEFAAVKPSCRHAEVEACFTAMSMGEHLEKLMGEEMREMVEKAEEASTKERTAELAQEKLEDLRDQAQQQHQDDGEVSDETQDAINDAVQRKTNAREAAAKAANDANAMPITVAAGQRIDQAAQEGKKAAQVIAGLPGVGKGEEKTELSVDEQLRLAQMFKDNPELFRIAEAVGRIVRDMRFKRARRIVGGAEEIVDVELGNDLPRVFPSELMLLLEEDEVFELDFFRRYSERSLLQWSKVGSAEAGKGPLVAVVDCSWSMEGSKNVWARALCLALLHISRREKRDFYVVLFSDTNEKPGEFYFPHKQKLNPEDVAKMAGYKLVLGTDITVGLNRGRDIILNSPDFSKADIVLMSDGEDWYESDDDTIKALLEEMGVRIHGILIGLRQSEYMDQMCHVQASAFDFTGPNAATDMLAAEIT